MKAHYLLGKTKLPEEIDKATSEILASLKGQNDKLAYLQSAYDLVTRKFEGGRVKTFSNIWQLFGSSIGDLMNRSGFMHCTNQNYILTNILVKSGLFNANEIKPRWTTIWYCTPHQYLEIKTGNSTVMVDCWGRHYGVPFGSYAKGFNTSIAKSFKI